MQQDGRPDKESLIAKLIDFGYASLNATKTMKINSLCTVSYSAPEIMANGDSSKASDIFSLGVLMWEVWTGCLAWKGAKDVQVFYAVTTGKTLEIPADLPRELAALMKSCMSFDPTDRPEINEVGNQLRSMICFKEEGIKMDISDLHS
jgi:serine/threonine-protein kinase